MRWDNGVDSTVINGCAKDPFNVDECVSPSYPISSVECVECVNYPYWLVSVSWVELGWVGHSWSNGVTVFVQSKGKREREKAAKAIPSQTEQEGSIGPPELEQKGTTNNSRLSVSRIHSTLVYIVVLRYGGKKKCTRGLKKPLKKRQMGTVN